MTTPDQSVIVVGAGDSALVPWLVVRRQREVIAVDVAPAALERLASSLGNDSSAITKLTADVRTLELGRRVDLWHDRAVFHFLTESADRASYARRAAEAVRPGGHLIVGTFAPDGPEACSGLPVARYDAVDLANCFDPHFELVDEMANVHTTPWGTEQAFTHIVCRRTDIDLAATAVLTTSM